MGFKKVDRRKLGIFDVAFYEINLSENFLRSTQMPNVTVIGTVELAAIFCMALWWLRGTKQYPRLVFIPVGML
jgi:hypothetical protein